MKNVYKIGISLIMLVAMFSGCGGDDACCFSDLDNNKTTVDQNQTPAETPGNITSIPGETETPVQTPISTQVPDVCSIANTWDILKGHYIVNNDQEQHLYDYVSINKNEFPYESSVVWLNKTVGDIEEETIVCKDVGDISCCLVKTEDAVCNVGLKVKEERPVVSETDSCQEVDPCQDDELEALLEQLFNGIE